MCKESQNVTVEQDREANEFETILGVSIDDINKRSHAVIDQENEKDNRLVSDLALAMEKEFSQRELAAMVAMNVVMNSQPNPLEMLLGAALSED